MKEIVRQLVEAYGPSGHEAAVRALIEGWIAGHVDEMRTDTMGNLIAHKKGTGGGKRIMLAAHMDEIAVVVTHVDKQGYVRFGRVGGVFAPTLVGGRVRFGNGVAGVIGWEKWLHGSTLPEWRELFIDVGASSVEDCPVRVGDMACFERPFQDLGKRWISKAMDDRVACAIAVQTLLEIKASPNDLYFVFTVQEEVGTRGAVVSAYGVEPEIGLAIDVTGVGDTPEAHPMNVGLGKGPAIKVMDSGMLAHPAVKDWMIRTAEQAGIPYQLEVLEFGGTDARAIQMSRGGVPAGCLSVPCRYVHTPSEMVDVQDIEQSVALLKALVSQPVAL